MKDSVSSDSCYYIKIFHIFCSEWILQVLFPSWLNVQPEKPSNSLTKVIKRSGATGVLRHKGRNGKYKHITYIKFDFIVPLSSV